MSGILFPSNASSKYWGMSKNIIIFNFQFSLNLIPAFGQLFNQKEEIQDHQEWFENNSTNKRWK
jgi:hypothetical protein